MGDLKKRAGRKTNLQRAGVCLEDGLEGKSTDLGLCCHPSSHMSQFGDAMHVPISNVISDLMFTRHPLQPKMC